MAAAAATYDLVLLLDTAAADDARAKIVSDTRDSLASGGEIVTEQAWGARQLAYEIDHREQAEYHLFQFHGPAELIASLDRTLRINDGVVRHRIIKLAPGTPAPQEGGPRGSAPRAAGESAAPAAVAADVVAPAEEAEAATDAVEASGAGEDPTAAVGDDALAPA
jgi:small subunit ribosomal protein S6